MSTNKHETRARYVPRICVLLALCYGLTSCQTNSRPAEPSRPASKLINENLRSQNEQLDVAEAGAQASETTIERIEGTGRFVLPGRSTIPAVSKDASGDIDLNFVDTNVRLVVDAVLGEMLNQKYVIDPGAEGVITLQSNRSLGESEVLYALEESLRMVNLAMVRSGDTLHIMQVRDAPRKITSIRKPLPPSANLPGFGVVAISLKYTTPAEIAKVLQPFAPQGAILSIDDSRNLILLGGTAQELSKLQELIRTFDVDWMKGMSFSLFTLQNVDVESMQNELESVFSDSATPIHSVVKFVPITRLNILLAISHSDEYLRRVEEWVIRLDKGGQTSGRKIYVYHIQNGKADTISSSLSQIFSTDSGARNQSQSSTNQQLQRTGNGLREITGGDSFGSQRLKIVPNVEDNSLLILATPEEYGVIEAALKQIDLPPNQVLIEATLAEVTLNTDLKYGVNWFLESGTNEFTFSSATDGSIAPTQPGFSFLHTGSSNKTAVLNALSSITDVDVVSSPKLMVLNNQTATLQVGDQVPVAVQSSQGTGDSNAPLVNTIQFRDTGVILSITPHINDGGLIILDVTQEVSEVAETRSSGIDSPTIQQRRISSTIAVQNGETVALGGLIRESTTVSNSGLPLLKDIPVIGKVFSTDSNVKRRTELIILITPRVMRNAYESRRVVDSLLEEFENLVPPPITQRDVNAAE